MALDLKQALQIIHRGEWVHNLRFITANVLKGVGGQVIELPKARITRRNAQSPKPIQNETELANSLKRPRHHEHFTINMELPNGKIRKIHPILITHMNNQELV